MSNPLNLLGYSHAELTIVSRNGSTPTGQSLWLAECSCGTLITVKGTKFIRRGIPKSCGCKTKELQQKSATTHGRKATPEYGIWAAMLQRCGNCNDKAYQNYGGRGITVCGRWDPEVGGSFENFLEDMGERPEGLSLERRNNNGGYSKENCTWESRGAQAFNRRLFSNNKSGHKGVYFNKVKQRWVAQIKKGHKTHYLGSFKLLEDAVTARELAEHTLYPVQKTHEIKACLEVELRIVGMLDGKATGKNASTFGSLDMVSEDEKLRVAVTGFSDELRQYIFDNWHEEFYGQVCTVKANQLLMPSKSNKHYSLFLPNYVEIRHDRKEADDIERIISIFKPFQPDLK